MRTPRIGAPGSATQAAGPDCLRNQGGSMLARSTARLATIVMVLGSGALPGQSCGGDDPSTAPPPGPGRPGGGGPTGAAGSGGSGGSAGTAGGTAGSGGSGGA